MKTNASFSNRRCTYLYKLPAAQAGLLVLFFCLVAAPATAQTYMILHTFGTNQGGSYPHAALVLGSDGAFYGSTEQGGVANSGQVFKVNPDGSGYMVLKDFSAQDGAGPEAALLLSGTTLFGTTTHGGISNNGTVFKLNTDGSGFTVLKQFSGGDGAVSYAALVLSGTTLYGTTFSGGSANLGTIFKIGADGSGFAVLKNFAGSDGSGPSAGLCLSPAGVLYGTTANGGSGSNGIVFKVNLDGSGFGVLNYFGSGSGGPGNGVGGPSGALVLSGETLYGTTLWGTNPGLGGTVFKLNTDGSGFAVIKDFLWNGVVWPDGYWPDAVLVMSGDTLYGSTYSGGSSNCGTVFKLNTDGSGFAVIKNFTPDEKPDGGHPYEVEWRAGLLLSGPTLYGTITRGGLGHFGSLFRLSTEDSEFAVLKEFTGPDGGQPYSGVAQGPDGTLYGTTSTGGSANYGTVFKLNPDGSGYATLKSFSGSDGASPEAGLAIGGTTLYGTTTYGGSSNSGTLFRIDTDGSGFSLLRSFASRSDGVYPATVPVLSGMTLYGGIDYGRVFRINTDGNVYSTFLINDNYGYQASLLLDGSTLYGTDGNTMVYRINTDWSGFAVIKVISGGVKGPLALSGGTLYGTSGGGTFHYGTVFKVNSDGTGYSPIKEFTGGSDGGYPSAGLLLGYNTLYGTSGMSPSGVNQGMVFKIKTDGTGFAVLKTFSGNDGGIPYGNLVLFGTNLYGTTLRGGFMDQGVVFRLSVPTILPVILTSPASQTAEAGATVAINVKAEGDIPLTYEWFFNSTNLIVVSNSRFLTLPDIESSQAGAYTVVVTNAFGAVTSAPAMLNVIPPVERRPVLAFNLTGQPGALMGLDYCDSLNPVTHWETVAMMTVSTPSQYYFDISAPLPPLRIYRSWQAGAPSEPPGLGLPFTVPALSLTGSRGNSIRVDGINQFGPTDAWFTLDTVSLTNTSQLYFDISAPGRPQRLYRLVPLP